MAWRGRDRLLDATRHYRVIAFRGIAIQCGRRSGTGSRPIADSAQAAHTAVSQIKSLHITLIPSNAHTASEYSLTTLRTELHGLEGVTILVGVLQSQDAAVGHAD